MKKSKVAIYLRLSKEDDKIKDESNSIRMQRLLLQDYVSKHFSDYELEEFVDDGFSGTNFNRPAITRLLEKARCEEVDCIVVKDFSRFARDYIELGSYLEQIFPFLGIRFISVNDRYDSNTYQGSIADLDMNFKNLLYDLYSKDLSQKVRSSLKARKEKGQYVSGNCPFGYKKAPDDRHMLVVKEDEALIVKRIFELALEGYTCNAIAMEFNEEDVKTPVEFKIEAGETSRIPKGDRFLWNPSTINSILRNPIYIGDIVYGKYEKDHVGGRNILKPRNEWKVYHNHHEAIVEQEIFNCVQMRFGKNTRLPQIKEHSPLIGIAVCSHCKRNLRYKDGKNPYFVCPTRYMSQMKECCEKVNVMFLEQAVLFELEGYLEKQGLSDNLSAMTIQSQEQQLVSIEKKMEKLQREYKQLQKENYENYTAYQMGQVGEYVSLKDSIEKKEQQILDLQKEKNVLEEQKGMSGTITVELKKELLKQYIDSVEVDNGSEFVINWRPLQTGFALS